MARLLEVDLMVYVFAACGAITVVLARLCVTQGRWQADEDAAVERWRSREGTGD